MFSLFVTVIAIALVVVLAAAAIYYGGASSKKAAARATALTLINQAVQIEAAGTVAVSQGVGWPATAPHFSQPFVKAMPVPPPGAYTHGIPAATDWEYYVPSPSTRHFVLKEKVSREVCMAVNKEFGMVGIPAVWTGTDLVQCFGPGVKAGADDRLSYTFFYDPLGATAAEEAAALAKSMKTATDAGVPSPTPGYPRLCPNDSVITSGVCAGEAGAPTAVLPDPDQAGFFIVTATSGSYQPTLVSEGFAETCPAGAVDPTGPGAAPIVTNPSEPFNVDAVMRTGWLVQPDWNDIYTTPLTRTWCFPAMKSETFPAGPLANRTYGDVIDVTLTPAVANANPMDYHWASSAATSFVAKGQAWTVVAVSFEADVWRTDNDDNPWMVGDKLAVGRGANLSATYYGGVPTLSYNGTDYAGERGTVTFTPTPPITPRKLAVAWPGGTGTTVPFPTTALTTASAPLPITFRNISSKPVPISAAPEVYGPFAIDSSTCTGSLEVGASCVISVVFVPTAEGPQSGGISVDIGGVPATPEFQGTGSPEPKQGYWLIEAKTWESLIHIKTLGFDTTCPAGSIDPTSQSAQPLLGLPADETLNVDALIKMKWFSNSEPFDMSGIQRIWCIPALSTEVQPLADSHSYNEARPYLGQDDYILLPDASKWYWVGSGSSIATATIKANGVVWTMAALTVNFHGSHPDFTPTAGMTHWVDKLAIGRVPSFTGTYYAGGPSRIDKNGVAHRNVGFARYGEPDRTVPAELVFEARNMYAGNAVIGKSTLAGFTFIENKTPDTLEITGQGIVGGSSSPFTTELYECGRYLAPGGRCLLFVNYTATRTGQVYDQFAIQTRQRTYIIDLMGEAK